jgi:hypothetical protein
VEVVLLQVVPLQGILLLGILLQVGLLPMCFDLVLLVPLRIRCSGLTEIFGPKVLRLVGLVYPVSLLNVM